MKIVKKIIRDVKKNGDQAILRYTEKFDKIKLKNIEISKNQIKEAYKKVGKETIKLFKEAIKNIERFSRKQYSQFKDFEYTKAGITLGQKIIPIGKIGVYVPGGNYPLPSTALMCIIPAKIVGVKNIIVCSPRIKPETIVAANLAGADKIFNVGGIQAIAAMTYGTKIIPKVDKIVGPGNIYVTLAKKRVYGKVGIDFLAGPSEILIIADKTSNEKFIAADLLAQAEHDVNAKLFLLTNSIEKIEQVKKKIKKQLNKLKTKSIAKRSLKNLKMIKVNKTEQAIEISNRIAPEHLELQIKNPRKYLNKLKNYGSLFIGDNAAEVFGDYCSGTNHVLPTEGTSRFCSGLSVKDFIKIQTYQSISKKGLKKLSKTAIKFAEIEGLDAHKKAAEIRIK